MNVRRVDIDPGQPGRFEALVVEPPTAKNDTPILLYLHGKGEASNVKDLSQVCVHLSPPFQAICGALPDVIVLAPQAPADPKKDPGWNWSPHIAEVNQFLGSNYPGREILATGFSRGGLGVLQFIKLFPDRVTRWAIVDPQAHPVGANGVGLSEQQCKEGWMRYGREYASIETFGNALHARLGDAPPCCKDMGHTPLARAAYGDADVLDGKESLYAWLDVTFLRKPPLALAEIRTIVNANSESKSTAAGERKS